MGMTGPDLSKFTDAVGEGSVMALSGKPFDTKDDGTVPGVGVGNGTGLKSVAVGTVSTTIFSIASGGFGGAGPDLLKVALAVETTLVTELANAKLLSGHPTVFLGTGIIVPGSVKVVGPEWGSFIGAAGFLKSFLGISWPILALAIGNGCAAGFTTVTGEVTITGSATGPTTGGTGVGTGVIS
jgi:hypothetical protein